MKKRMKLMILIKAVLMHSVARAEIYSDREKRIGQWNISIVLSQWNLKFYGF